MRANTRKNGTQLQETVCTSRISKKEKSKPKEEKEHNKKRKHGWRVRLLRYEKP